MGAKQRSSNSKSGFDASIEANITERVNTEAFLLGMQTESSTTSGRHQETAQSIAQTSSVKGHLDEHIEFTLPSTSWRALELASLRRNETFSGLVIHASVGGLADGGATHRCSTFHQHTEQRVAHLCNTTNQSQSHPPPQTNSALDLWRNDEGRSAGSTTAFDVSMTDFVQVNRHQAYTSNITHNITKIFDDEMDGGEMHRENVETEEYYPATIDPSLTYKPSRVSPALSLDIPTNIFFTPSVSELDDSALSRSSSQRPHPQRRNKVFSHVAVPPFPEDYRRRPRPGKAGTHSSLRDALQAAMNNNGALYTVSQQQQKKKHRLSPEPSMSEGPKKKSRKKAGEPLKKVVEHHRPSMDINTARPSSPAGPISTTHGVTIREHEFGYTHYDPTNDILVLMICATSTSPLEVVEANMRTTQPGGKRRYVSPHVQTEAVKGEQGYAFLKKCSTACESLEKMEGDLGTGDFLDSFEEAEVDGSVSVHDQGEGEGDDDDDEIVFVGYAAAPQPTGKSGEPRSRVSNSPVLSRRATRVEAPADEIQIITPPALNVPQPKQKSKPRRRKDSTTGTSTMDDHRTFHRSSYTLQPRQLLSPPIHPNDAYGYPLPQAREPGRTDNGEYRPSAKALGKRRAVEPEDEDHRGTGFAHVRPQTRPVMMDRLHQMNDLLFDTLASRSLSHLDPSVLHLGLSNEQALSPPRNALPSQNHPESSLTELSALASSQPPNVTVPSATLSDSPDGFLTTRTSPSPFLAHASDVDTFLSGPYQRNPDSPVIELNHFGKPDKAFTDPLAEWTSDAGDGLDVQTIDPYILGSSMLEDEEVVVPRALSPPPTNASALLALAAYGSDTRSSPPHSAFSARFSSPPNELLSPHSLERPSPRVASPSPSSESFYAPSPSSSEKSHPSPPPQSPVLPLVNNDEPSSFKPPRRASRNAQPPDGMVSTAKIVLPGDSDDDWTPPGTKQSQKKSRPIRLQPQVITEDGSTWEQRETPSPKAVRKSQQSSKSSRGTPWPTESTESYCHQCRNKTFRVKYEESTYSFQCSPFTCPFCENVCSCDVCCRKRGEVYINRTKGVPTDKETVLLPKVLPKRQTQSIRRNSPTPSVTRPRLAGKTNLPPPTIATTPKIGEFWGTIFGMDGKPVGPSFVSQSQDFADVDEDMPVSRTPSPPPSRHRRIFIGKVQKSWGLKPPYDIRDHDPLLCEDKSNGSKTWRYIGDKSLILSRKKTAKVPVSSVVIPRSVSIPQADAGSLSPLSSLDDSDDDDDAGPGSDLEGESHEEFAPIEADFEMAAQKGVDGFLAMGPGTEFSPDCLAETDVARAISLSLIACGMTVKLSAI
ncbi:hypothetical protein H0H92_003232 [Tricholoma furcatifolium]|nr:hypothetical protein H0H92_003232 [Tricholoma furcatifolium]